MKDSVKDNRIDIAYKAVGEFGMVEFDRLLEELNGLTDEKYREFHSKLIPGVESKFLGIRVPILRKVARKLVKGDFRGFIRCTDERFVEDNIYEVNMLLGMVIGLAKMEFEERLCYLDKFVPKIDNWAVCDITVGDMKSIKKNKDKMYEYVQKYLNSDREYEVRFAVVVLMQYFTDEDYIDAIFQIYDNIRHDGYYVKMAVAWAISVCFVKFRNKTLDFLDASNLDDFTYNKSLQKIRESNRVCKEDKDIVKRMKR